MRVRRKERNAAHTAIKEENMFEDCLDDIANIKTLIKRDENEISSCINGEIMVVYLQGLERANDVLREIQHKVWALQDQYGLIL